MMISYLDIVWSLMFILMTRSRVYVENAGLSNVMSDFHSLADSRTLLCNAGAKYLY
jgi:hypothetical protein